MRKSSVLLWCCTALFSACTQHQCHIEGTVENAKDGDSVFLGRMTDGQFIPSDTLIVKDNTFKATIPCDSSIIATFYYSNKHSEEVYSNVFFIEPGNVTLNIGRDSSVSGTRNNETYQAFVDSLYMIQERLEQIYTEKENETDSSDTSGLDDEIRTLENRANALVLSTIRNEIHTPVGYFLFLSCYNMLTPEECLQLTEKLPSGYKGNSVVQLIMEEARRTGGSASGRTFINTKLPDMNGGMLNLSDVIKANRLTLIDCWASWCGPCKREMPHVSELYAKYHKSGLEIIGISFDEDEDAWHNAVKELHMTWPQVSELKGWDNIIRNQYNISFIPYTILVDQNGVIIATELRGNNLEEVIKHHLQ